MSNDDWNKSITELLRPLTDEELAIQREKGDAFLRKIFSGDVEDNTLAEVLRTIVEKNCWFIPLREDGQPAIVTAAKGEFERAVWGEKKSDGRRVVRKGQGGQLLPIYLNSQHGRSSVISGCDLVRSLPSAIDGLLLYEDSEQPLELSSEYFPKMKALIGSVEVESSLIADEPIDTGKLKQYEWLVDMVDNEHLRRNTSVIEANVGTAFTHGDREFDTDHRPAVTMDGAALFRKVLDTPNFDGLAINSPIRFGSGKEPIQNMVLSLGFLQRAVSEDSCYLRVVTPQARSIKEVEMWLLLNEFPEVREIFEEINPGGETVIYAAAKSPSISWRSQETFGEQEPALVKSPRFVIKPAPDTMPGYGKGRSKILCPGLIARCLYLEERSNEGAHSWPPGRNFLIGKLLNQGEIDLANQRLRLAHELLKLLPDGEQQIPRTECLSVSGAAFLRRLPETGSRMWIEKTIRNAEKYARKWVWGG